MNHKPFPLKADSATRFLEVSSCSRRGLHSTQRTEGMFDGFKEQWQSSKEEYSAKQQDDQFRQQVADLLRMEKFTLQEFHESMKGVVEKSGLDGWKKHVPGVKSNDNYQQMMKMMEVMDAIPPELRATPDKIKATERARIAKGSGDKVKVADINQLLKQFQELKSLHTWLRKRAAAGKKIPQSMSEMGTMALEPDSGFQKKASMVKKMSGRR